MDVLVRIVRPVGESLSSELERFIALGVVQTELELRTARVELVERRQASILAVQQPILDLLESSGGEILHRCKNMPCLAARLPPSLVWELVRHPYVERIDLDDVTRATSEVMGDMVIRGTQIAQFIDAGYDGENGSGKDITFGVVEISGFNDEHLGYRDSSGLATRIRRRVSCTGKGCVSVPNFPRATDNHGMGVSGIIFGDLRDGQDPSVTNSGSRINRSGYAGEAQAFLYDINASVSGLQAALDDIVARAPYPSIVNLSLEAPFDDKHCKGQSALSRSANDLFEAGILLIKSAGNSGHAGGGDCTVGSPGSAIGTFTVGGHGNSITGTQQDVRYASIYKRSSRGGVSWAEGRNRTIVDVTAFPCRDRLFDRSGRYSYSGCGTSFSTPTVAAGAINFIDFYKQAYSNLIDNPGLLFANLLLMGDREGERGRRSNEFDSLWGAGRFKMRRWDGPGLDAPAGWKSGWTCIGDGEIVNVDVNNGMPLDPSVNDFKAVLFWYDRRHENGERVDDIDLRLRKVGGGTLVKSIDSYDNKERVYYSKPGGKALTLEISGERVTADSEGCGTNSMKVYYAFFFEDDARNDADGPGSEIDKE